MFLQDYIGVGTPVRRADNPRHHGRVVAATLPSVLAARAVADSAIYVVLWANGWREECGYAELKRDD